MTDNDPNLPNNKKNKTELPSSASYPGSINRPWNKIPLGAGAKGEVDINLKETPHTLIVGPAGAGKSVVLRNVVFHAIQHKEDVRILGIDLKRVQLRPYAKYSNVVTGIATTLEDALVVLRHTEQTMMERYQEMEEQGTNSLAQLNPSRFVIFLVIEEFDSLVSKEGIKTKEGRESDELKEEAFSLISNIARLGRAAGIHLFLSTQRPDAKVFGEDLNKNFTARIAAGRMDAIASHLTLGNDEATKLPSIKGRGYLQTSEESGQFQGYYAEEDWIDKYLEFVNED